MSDKEIDANEAIKTALQALQHARELSERTGYGSQVLEPLWDAQRGTQYAYDTATGHN